VTAACRIGKIVQGATPDDIVPGVTWHGTDVGRWLERQRQHVIWEGLNEGQRALLTALGITPLPPEQQETPAKASRAASGAFEWGCAALSNTRHGRAP
jgi:hypothetical protein